MGLGLSGLRLGLGQRLRTSTVIPAAVLTISRNKSATYFTNADAADLTAAAAWVAANPSYTNPEFFRRFPEWPFYSDIAGTTPALEGDTVAFAPNLLDQTFLRPGSDAALLDVWDKARRLQLGRDAQLVINLVGNSWVEGPYWVPAFTKQLQDAYGIAGLGWVGFQYFGSTAPTYWINPGTQPAGKTQGSSRPDLIAEPVLNGTWAGENGAGGIAAPSIGGIIGSDSGSGYVQFVMPAGHDSATLYYFGDGTGVIKHSWNGGSTWESNTSLSTVGPASVALSNCPATQATLRIHVVSGNVSLAGVYLESSASGVRVNALGASGSNTSQWAGVNTTTWAAQVASLGGDLTIGQFGVNDQSGSTPPATTAGNMTTLFTALESGDTAALLVMSQPAVSGDAEKTYQMTEYATAVSAAAETGGWPFMDLQPFFGDDVDDYVDTLLDGGSHPSDAGGTVIQNAVRNSFAPNVTAPPEMCAVQAIEADRPTLVTGLGPELITNGGFDVDANWTKQNGWGIASGIATHAGTTGGNLIPSYSGSLEVGKTYRVAWEQSNSWITVSNYTNTVSNTNAAGARSADFVAEFAQLWWRTSTDGATVDNASLREVSADYGNSLINGHFDIAYPAEVVGSDLITNGGFDADANWTKGPGWGIADGRATHAGTTAGNLVQTSVMSSGVGYRIEWEQGGSWVTVYDPAFLAISNSEHDGEKSVDFTATGTGSLTFRTNYDGSWVDNVSVRELLTSADYTRSVRSPAGVWSHTDLASQSGTAAMDVGDFSQLMVATPVLSTEEKATLI